MFKIIAGLIVYLIVCDGFAHPLHDGVEHEPESMDATSVVPVIPVTAERISDLLQLETVKASAAVAHNTLYRSAAGERHAPFLAIAAIARRFAPADTRAGCQRRSDWTGFYV